MNTLREAIAAQAHESWADWMEYLFSKCTFNDDGSATIPSDLVLRWTAQLCTIYPELTDTEKESDRAEADKYLYVVNRHKLGMMEPLADALMKIKASVRRR